MSTIDPRDIPDVTRVGTRLRDAAVTPREDDFLPPTNAGAVGSLGNPHGPTVVSPEIHGSAAIRPGVVSDDPATQSLEETEFLYERQPQTNPVQSLVVTGDSTVEVGATGAFVATADFLHTDDLAVTDRAEWTSSADEVATVAAGTLTGVSAGTATITASYGGKTGTLEVTVTTAA